MHEYEFRLVVENSSSFLPLLQTLKFPIKKQIIYYLKPHFRYRNGHFETKRMESTYAVYHDSLWFRWIHSIETPYHAWSHATYLDFLHNIGNYQHPFKVETRYGITIDGHTQLYTFQTSIHTFKLVFEWEYGTFSKPITLSNPAQLLSTLTRYRDIYNLFQQYPLPSYTLNENLTRKPVTCIETIPKGDPYLYAHKLDGVFGLVYSYTNKIKEKWEGYECVVRPNETLGDGLVFAAERLENGDVYLLDVYHVRGHDTAKWCRKEILTHFLSHLSLLKGYFIQHYVSDPECLNTNPPFKTDGLIIHNVLEDVILKYKTSHSIDVVYYRNYFYLPNGRIKCSQEGLEDGSVYEISTQDGRVMRQRKDRFKGNTSAQLDNVLKNGWHGPPIQPLPVTVHKKMKRKK